MDKRDIADRQQVRMREEARISIRDLGPIAAGTVDLRPLTVFVGPSNTGKTYLSILIYALHQVLGGLRNLPLGRRRFWPRSPRPDEGSLSDDDYRQLQRDLSQTHKPLMYYDLPIGVRNALEASVKESGAEAELELRRCFDATGMHELARTSSSEKDIEISIQTRSQGDVRWHIDMNLSDQRCTASGKISDFVLIPVDQSPQSKMLRSRRLDLLEGSDYSVFRIVDRLFRANRDGRPAAIHYLPAARSGIMQSHRVIASSLVMRSTRGGLERFPEIPAFSGVMADFIQRLIMYRSEKEADRRLDQIARDLETHTLDGLVGSGPSPGGYPEFVYRPQGAEDSVRMTRASSMVSELAPVVLFLRGVLAIGDTLIIEEPEAHLHPAAQTHVAVALARLVRAGVRVIITTHSDWLLKEIGNLMREGELAEQTGKPAAESALSTSLHPNDVGIWLFRRDGSDQGSTIQEIPFDRSEGVEPAEYDDVAEQLYNRAADLQNKLEASGGNHE